MTFHTPAAHVTHQAALEGHERVARLLVTVGHANRHARSSTGEIPLSYAARSGSNDIVRFLADGVGGEDVNARAQNSRLPIHFAARAGHTNTVRILGNFCTQEP